MNKRYIDFVPREEKTPRTTSQSAERVLPQSTPVTRPQAAQARRPQATPTVRPSNTTAARPRQVAARPAEAPRPAESANFGIIEDYQPRFLNTQVSKRPLSSTQKSSKGAEVGTASASGKRGGARVLGKNGIMQADKQRPYSGRPDASSSTPQAGRAAKGTRATTAATSVAQATAKASSAAKVSATAKLSKFSKKTPFVNTEKIAKRPLSKNVYPKKVITPKEEPSGLVTIITKPEKDSKAGLIVAIIITIILGAAAGTVAFLLLPK